MLYRDPDQFSSLSTLRKFVCVMAIGVLDRKSTRLNSSHLVISYAVFCLKKKMTLLGGGTIAALIVIEVWFDPQDDRAIFAYVLLLGLASTALMTVQPAGTAVLGTYTAVR